MRDKVILLVEDNPDDELLALRALRRDVAPREVVVARDGAEALDFLFSTGRYAEREPYAMPDLILLDLKLPKIDGLGVLRRMRASENTRLTPVVVLTSSREERDIIESYDLGANSYIRKPVDFEQFTRAVGQIKLYWLDLTEPPPTRS